MPQITIDYESQTPGTDSQFQIAVTDKQGERIISSDGDNIVVDVDSPFEIRDLGVQPAPATPERAGWRGQQ